MDRTIVISDFPKLSIFKEAETFNTCLKQIEDENGIFLYKFSIEKEAKAAPKPITLRLERI